MKRLFKNFPILMLVLLVSASCSKDWLEPDPLSFLAPENVYVDEAGFESILITLRKNLQYESTGQRHPLATEHAVSDLAVPVFQADFRRNTPSDSQFFPFLSMYDKVYEFIKNSNVLISRIDDIEWADQEVRNRLVAEAYWHRAYWYYRLVHTYGDVPWIGTELKGAKLDFQTHSREAILGQIQNDLEFSVQHLPINPAILGDVTKGTAQHLLAKVYLANTEFEKAVAVATEVIEGPYELMYERFGIDADDPNRNVIWDLHRYQNFNSPQNSETIYTTVDRPDAPPVAWSAGAYTMRLYNPSYWKILDSSGARACNHDQPVGNPISDTLGVANGDVRLNHFYQYKIWEDDNHTFEETPDLRRADINWVEMGAQTAEIYVCRPGSPNIDEPFNKDFYGNLADTTDTWWSFPHYITFVPDPNNSGNRGGQADWYVYRLAETYLLRAEAYFWQGQMGLAADDINKVRDRAEAPLISSGEVTLDYIFDERARELFAEEPRHSEMVRVSYIAATVGMFGYNMSDFSQNNWYYDRVMKYNNLYHPPRLQHYGNTAWIDPHNVLWPIPQSVITANTQGTINQNIGYDGAENNVPPLDIIEMPVDE